MLKRYDISSLFGAWLLLTDTAKGFEKVTIQNDEICSENDEFCIENDEFCIENDEFCIQNDKFCI